MANPAYEVRLSSVALAAFRDIASATDRKSVRAHLDQLATGPFDVGRDLLGALAGFRRLKAAGRRYRIVYRVDIDRAVVEVWHIGRRQAGKKEDVYAQMLEILMEQSTVAF